MIFSRTETLEDLIVRQALASNISIKELHSELSRGSKLSIRAIYKSVDKLLDAGVLLKVGKRVIVDAEWKRTITERLKTQPIATPSVGERITHSFVSFGHLDSFWKTVVLPIEEKDSSTEIFFYNPHDFWAYMPERKGSEEAYYSHFTTEKRRGFFTLGGEFEADMDFKRKYQDEYLQIDTREVAYLKRNEHLTLMGSLIITVRLSRMIAARIDELYASNRSIKDILPELLAVCRAPGTIKFIIENNPTKAKKLRKILARNFYFPQPK